mgnify:CR=1 FL=1
MTDPEPINEVERDQVQCGQSKCNNYRAPGYEGTDAKLGQAPYQMRIRYFEDALKLHQDRVQKSF